MKSNSICDCGVRAAEEEGQEVIDLVMFTQIPVELWQALNEDAERNARSATKQLLWILRQQYPDAKPSAPDQPEAPPPAKKRRSKK
jgi:hypothetical protein